MALAGQYIAPVTTNPAFPASPYDQAPKPQPKPKNFSGFGSKEQESLYD